jgi:hypothetical protein
MAIEIDKESFQVDRLGKIRLQRRYLTDSRTEALTELPKFVDGLPLSTIQGSVWISKNDGRHVVDAVYEGLIKDPDESLDEYELITEEREQKIESFPDVQRLYDEYSGYIEDNTLQFSPYLPKPKSRLGQPLTLDTMAGKSNEIPNPLFGAKTYPVPHTTAVWRMVRKKVPSSLVSQEGLIIDRLPSGFDYSGQKKQWYVKPLQKRKRGNAWTIEWTAFQVTGFTDLQVLLVLKGKKKENGLTTGGLTTGSL